MAFAFLIALVVQEVGIVSSFGRDLCNAGIAYESIGDCTLHTLACTRVPCHEYGSRWGKSYIIAQLERYGKVRNGLKIFKEPCITVEERREWIVVESDHDNLKGETISHPSCRCKLPPSAPSTTWLYCPHTFSNWLGLLECACRSPWRTRQLSRSVPR